MAFYFFNQNYYQTSFVYMNNHRQQQVFRKKYMSSHNNQSEYYSIFDPYTTPYKQTYNTIESQQTQEPLQNAHFSVQSSRIADEVNASTNMNQCEQIFNQRLSLLQEEASQVMNKKERQVYFLKVELGNYEIRLRESQEKSLLQQKEIERLRTDIRDLMKEKDQNKGKDNQQFQENSQIKILKEQNEKLKESLNILIDERNQIIRKQQKKEFSCENKRPKTLLLKKQVQQLRAMVAQMKQNVQNCPSCFAMKRQNEQLIQAYQCIQKQYNQVLRTKTKQQKSLLQNITTKIQQNQNIIRQNLQLRQKGKVSIKFGRQRLTESVAKRCRTLTDQY